MGHLFDSFGLTPHGFCLSWQPGLLWLHIASDSFIGLSYYSIPVALAVFASQRKDIAFGGIFWMFGAFILCCGTTHLFEIWTLWHPDYFAQGLIKAVTAVISLATAAMLWPLLPKALALPSPATLREANDKLRAEVTRRGEAVEALQREILLRERAVEELHTGEDMFRRMVNGITDYAFYRLDPAGIVSSWNTGAERIKGYTAEEIIGQSYAKFYTEADRQSGAPARSLRIAAETGRYAAISERVRKDGTMFWADMVIEPIRRSDGTLLGFVKITRDVSERREASARRELLAAVFDSTPDAILVVGTEGQIVSASRHTSELFGHPLPEMVGRGVEILLPNRFRQDHIGQRMGFLAAPRTRRMGADSKLFGLRADGTEFPIEVMLGSLQTETGTFALAIVHDITERLAAEEALADSRAKQAILAERAQAAEALRRTTETLTKIIDACPLGIFALGDGDVAMWNPAGQQIFGLDTVDPSSPFSEIERALTPPDAMAGDDVRSLVRERGKIRNLEMRRRRLDGSAIDLSVSGALLGSDPDNPEGYLFIVDDITQRKSIEEQLRQAQKMEAIGQLTGGIAHDFNNLLAVVQGNLELINDEIGPDSSLKELVGDALSASARGANLTHRLLAYSRQQQLAPSVVDVSRLIGEVIAVLRRVMAETIRIETVLAPGLWHTMIDASQLESALLNLAINARDAMPDGGELTITAENAILDEHYADENADVRAGPYVLVAVSDTGTGMPKNVIDRALEPFFTTKPVGRGTGLGLSMVYGFVKQSGGHLKIYSEPGHGTTVKLFLPQAGQLLPDDAKLRDQIQDEAAASTDRLVLVVEDERSVRQLQLKALKSLGYRTLEAEDGDSALAVIDANSDIDLLLTDLVLPGRMNGLAIANEARKRLPELKVIFMSGYAPNIILRTQELEGSTVLSKPFPRAALARAVHDILEGEDVP